MQTMMKSSIINLICLIWLPCFTSLLMVQPAHAQLITIASDAAVPLELKFLLESLNHITLDPTEQNEIKQILTTLNRALPFIEKPYRYFLIKKEIYQSLLDIAQQNNQPLTLTQLSIAHLQKITTGTTGEQYSLFALWLIEALASDLWELSESPLFKKIALADLRPPLSASDQLLPASHLRSKRSLELTPPTNERQKALERKVRLVAYWYQEITNKKPAEFNSSLKQTFFTTLRAIEMNVSIFINFTAAKYRMAQAPATQTLTHSLFTIQLDSTTDQPTAYLTKGELNRYQEFKRKEAEEVVAKISPLDFTTTPATTPLPSSPLPTPTASTPLVAPTPTAPTWIPKEQPSQLPSPEAWKPVR